jgi:hypothetical protein
MLEPAQLEAMRFYEARVGVAVSEQVRRAVDAWLHNDPMVSKILEELPAHRAEHRTAVRKVAAAAAKSRR